MTGRARFMRQGLTLGVVILAAAMLAGCQSATMSEYSVAGVQHSEPVQFNGDRYQVDFVYSNALAGFDVQVNRPAKPLGGGETDRSNSLQVARSAITHFACANGQKAHVVDGSPSFTGSSTWALQAKCAS